MRRFLGWIGLVFVLVLGVGFAAWNAGREVTIDLGILTFYRVPITFVAFGGMVVGMGVVLVAGINADLKVRALLQKAALPESRSVKRGVGPRGTDQERFHPPSGEPAGPVSVTTVISEGVLPTESPGDDPPTLPPEELPLE